MGLMRSEKEKKLIRHRTLRKETKPVFQLTIKDWIKVILFTSSDSSSSGSNFSSCFDYWPGFKCLRLHLQMTACTRSLFLFRHMNVDPLAHQFLQLMRSHFLCGTRYRFVQFELYFTQMGLYVLPEVAPMGAVRPEAEVEFLVQHLIGNFLYPIGQLESLRD